MFWVPADTDLPMEMKVVQNNWRSLADLVEGYMEIVRTEHLPELSCGCRLIMVVNDNGLAQNLSQNQRAQVYYPHSPIVGNVFFVGEGLVQGEEGTEVDMFSLPQCFTEWEGPGAPVPSGKQPWE